MITEHGCSEIAVKFHLRRWVKPGGHLVGKIDAGTQHDNIYVLLMFPFQQNIPDIASDHKGFLTGLPGDH